MAQKLKSYFDEANKLGGMKGELRLVMMTKITRIQAESGDDAPDKIASFENAIKEVRKEFVK